MDEHSSDFTRALALRRLREDDNHEIQVDECFSSVSPLYEVAFSSIIEIERVTRVLGLDIGSAYYIFTESEVFARSKARLESTGHE